MAKKNRPRRRKSKPAHAAPVAQAFPASVAAAEFLAICSEAARRGQSSSPAVPKESRIDDRLSELEEGIEDLPAVSPDVVNSLDGVQAVEYLGQVQEPFRAALTLFYMNDASYQEIADILQVPLGTVRS